MWPNGVGSRHLRWNLWIKSLKICRQSGINEPNLGVMVGFEFKMPYKLQVAIQRKTLGILKIQLLRYQVCMDRVNFEALRESLVFERFLKET